MDISYCKCWVNHPYPAKLWKPRSLACGLFDPITKRLQAPAGAVKLPANPGLAPMAENHRDERLQILLTKAEIAQLDDWRFARRMPSRAAAVRELLKRGLNAGERALSVETDSLQSQETRH